MKKLLLGVASLALLFASCETEPLDQGLDGVNARIKVQDCQTDLTLRHLPEQVDACVTEKGPDAVDSYFNITISSPELLAGDYDAWCVDQDLTLDDDECFTADVYSSYEDLPAGVFEKPENFDLVNWLLNQTIIGVESTLYPGEYFTFGDLQRAIWYLVDDSNCVACTFLGPYSDARSLELVGLAESNGEGFEPGVGETIAVILIPTDGETQSVIIPYELPCVTCETAYAYGDSCFIPAFKNWGWVIGPISDGYDETHNIWAGAGQCDTSKGTLVGTVNITYSGGVFNYVTTIDPAYAVDELHVYAGNDMYPKDKKGKSTVAPGQYTIADDLGAEIYVIMHWGVCGVFD